MTPTTGLESGSLQDLAPVAEYSSPLRTASAIPPKELVF